MCSFGRHLEGHNPAEAPLRFFQGCTVRFACFCNTRRVLFSPRNTPRQHFFTSLTNSCSEPREEGPRALPFLLWSLRKHPENAPETGHPKNSLFAPGTPEGGIVISSPGPGKWNHKYIYIYIYVYLVFIFF